MKKIFSSFFILPFLYISAQSTYSYLGEGVPKDNTYFGTRGSNAKLSYADIQGSPYYDINFSSAKFISGNTETALARYNSYSDEIEFQKDNKTFSLPPTSTFTRIEFTDTEDKLVKIDTNDDLSGYFFELVNGNISLYKKIKTKFVSAVPASSSYSSDKPASFKTLAPVYYIKTDKGFIKNPKNQKDITEQIPEKKEAIETFVKSNKIKFNKEEDLIKLVNFLNQN